MKYDFEKLMQEYDKLLEKKRRLEEKVKTRAKKLVPYIAKKYSKNTPYFNRCVKVGEVYHIELCENEEGIGTVKSFIISPLVFESRRKNVKAKEIRPIKNFGCCYALEFNG